MISVDLMFVLVVQKKRRTAGLGDEFDALPDVQQQQNRTGGDGDGLGNDHNQSLMDLNNFDWNQQLQAPGEDGMVGGFFFGTFV